MQNELCSLDVPQKAMSEARSIRRAFDQAWNVGDDKRSKVAHIDDAEVWFERCERVIGDLRFGGRDDRDQCRFTCVWKTDEAYIGDQLQLQLQLSFAARPPCIMIFWSTARRRRKMCVSPTAFAAFCGEVTLPRFSKIKQQLVRLGIENLRPDRYPDDRVLAVLAGAV